MTNYRASHLYGKTIRQVPIPSGFALMSLDENDKKSTEKIEGQGLEQMSDKLEKLIVKPRRKVKNIQFNP